ncbi:MAG TPA: 2-oxoacid:acceptor oxidoreductase subunit alpha [Candidatus Competibacter sp.]|nr:2-oxoacid:acceptor oxidoreductase subunit alpha [Candidatus Competibacter sp.]
MLTSTSPNDVIAIAIVGSGGAGAITVGSLLLEAAGRIGWYGLMTRSIGPQIRGGEALAMVRLAPVPVLGHGDRFDVLLALDWHNADRFVDEVPLDADSLIIADAGAGDPSAAILASGAHLVTVPLTDLADDVPEGRSNIVALGMLARLLALPLKPLAALVVRALNRKGLDPVRLHQTLAVGHGAAAALDGSIRPPPLATDGGMRWLLTGNEAAALGALRGGVRFAAVYPITPATDLSEWLAPRLRQLGGHLIQAEDEIAALNMVLGAAYGGMPALTATSGPGLALMSETLGLAVAAEIPAVIINVMRGGPSTGIPTKSEQSDLNIALYGLHGDAPHLVLAPSSVSDCLAVTQWAVQLAEALQCPAIVLSDQFLGQSQTVCDRLPIAGDGESLRLTAKIVTNYYDRYAVTADGVSPMSLPGTPGGQYTADGLEHNVRGVPSSRATDHQSQLDKRRDKLLRYDYGPIWAEVEGDGEAAVLTWGSTAAPVREAAALARAQGLAVKVLVLRLLLPAQPARLARLLEGVRRVLVVEQSHSQQFYSYLKAHYTLPAAVRVLARPGPLSIRPAAVLAQLLQWR